METFPRLFDSLLRLVYHCFGRIVIFGYPPLLSPPGHISCFFRDVHGAGPSPKTLRANASANRGAANLVVHVTPPGPALRPGRCANSLR